MNMNVEATYKLPDGFRTSINVLNRVLNIPSSTIEHELKKHNYSFYSQSSNCIDEKMLDIFAEKFCKNLKRYFERSLHEYETLSYEESKQFHDFVHNYSKNGRFTKSWRNIDKVAIKDDFLRQVVELTFRQKSIKVTIDDSLKEGLLRLAESIICVREREVQPIYKVESSSLKERIESAICRCNNERLRVFDAADSFLLKPFNQFYRYDLDYYLDFTNDIESQSDSISTSTTTQQEDFHNRVILVEKIKHSRLYLSRRPSLKYHTNKFVPLFVRIYACARFHIVSDEGTDDEISFTNSLRA